MTMILNLLRFVLNMLTGAGFVWLSYWLSNYLALRFVTTLNDQMMLGLVQQYDYVVGAIGVMVSLVLLGFVVILHDIGEWTTGWFIRPFQRRASDDVTE